MAELLIRVVDKVNPEFYANTKCTKRGDVIVVCPDEWVWGTEEKSLPQYRIVRFTNLSVSEASALLAPELNIDPLRPSLTLQRRAFKLDLESAGLPASVKTWLADTTRAQPMLIVTLPLLSVQALKLTKPPIVDPAVIG